MRRRYAMEQVFKDILTGYGYRGMKIYDKYRLHLYYTSSVLKENHPDFSKVENEVFGYLEVRTIRRNKLVRGRSENDDGMH